MSPGVRRGPSTTTDAATIASTTSAWLDRRARSASGAGSTARAGRSWSSISTSTWSASGRSAGPSAVATGPAAMASLAPADTTTTRGSASLSSRTGRRAAAAGGSSRACGTSSCQASSRSATWNVSADSISRASAAIWSRPLGGRPEVTQTTTGTRVRAAVSSRAVTSGSSTGPKPGTTPSASSTSSRSALPKETVSGESGCWRHWSARPAANRSDTATAATRSGRTTAAGGGTCQDGTGSETSRSRRTRSRSALTTAPPLDAARRTAGERASRCRSW